MPSAGVALTTVAEFGRLGLQAWTGREEFNQAIVGTNPWPNSPTAKPDRGFFTSSWNEESQTSEWMRSKSYMLRGDPDRRAPVLLSPVPNATLFVIDSIDDFEALASQYPHKYSNPRDLRRRPDWGKLAGLVGAVHVTAGAVADGGNCYVHAWEVESTLWFRGDILIRQAQHP
jgi:hypothetical protein